MSNAFADSNVCVYAWDNSNITKKKIAIEILKNGPIISSQVCIECLNVFSKKLKLSDLQCIESIDSLMSMADFRSLNSKDVRLAFELKLQYSFSFLDSFIVASALLTGCDTLYTEDMQHGLVVEKKLKIINPFL